MTGADGSDGGGPGTEQRVFGVTGWKNAGKTGLMERLVGELTRRGLTISTLKHAHHSFDVDHPGRDSHRHREAGAHQVLISSEARWALMTESRGAPEPRLSDLLRRLAPVDLVLIEGWKRDPHPKIEAWRAETAHPLIAPRDPTIRAVASDAPLELDRPVFDLDDTSAIADFVLAEVGLGSSRAGPRTFDDVVIVDWTGGGPSPATPSANAIWIGRESGGTSSEPLYVRDRPTARDVLTEHLDAAVAQGRRVLVGFDFPFAFPKGFAEALTGQSGPFPVWDWLAERITDLRGGTDRIDVAAEANRHFPGDGPFWFNNYQRTRPLADLPHKRPVAPPLDEWRGPEEEAAGAFSVWQLGGGGAPGSQALMGLPVLRALRRRYGSDLSVWPFEAPTTPIVLVEIFPSILRETVARHLLRMQDTAQGPGTVEIKDRAQVRILARALANLTTDEMAGLLDVAPRDQGWILGMGHADLLTRAFERDPGCLQERAP
ncbi:MAG: molybdopterin-guanine dinucleotide biosynthesis protein B [Shimia sp.]